MKAVLMLAMFACWLKDMIHHARRMHRARKWSPGQTDTGDLPEDFQKRKANAKTREERNASEARESGSEDGE